MAKKKKNKNGNDCLPSQSQFRFDNESYLNLPENHKRVSIATVSNDESDSSIASYGDVVDPASLSAIATLNAFLPTIANVSATHSTTNATNANPNTAIDEHNIASVSMLFIYLFVFFSSSFFWFLFY